MTFDPQFFGYGVALVVAAWVTGYLVGMALRVLRRMSDIF